LIRATILLAACLLVLPALPLGGAAVQATTVMELKAKAPDWWTPEVRLAAQQAALEGKLLNPLTGETFTPREAAALVTVPVGAPDYLFIRPGSLALTESGFLCTYNFIYSAGTQIGTAGHCPSYAAEPFYILSTPAPTIPLVSALGTAGSYSNGGIGNDWALININPSWRAWVDPSMAWLGGPSCSTWNGASSIVKHTGHGIQTGLVGSIPRLSDAGPSDGNSFSGYGGVSGGDSGSPMIQVFGVNTGCALGSAAGILTHCASIGGTVCLPLFYATDIRKVPATVTIGFDPI
jgi:hypothetical protein